MNFQKTFILGRVAHSPEVKTLDSGTTVATFSMATNRTWKDAAGAQQEATEWHNCVAFGKLAEILKQYLQGGQLLFVEGRNQTRSWDDKDTQKKMYRTEIVVEGFQFGAKAASRNGGAVDNEKTAEEVKTGGYTGPLPETIDYGAPDINVDDIPF